MNAYPIIISEGSASDAFDIFSAQVPNIIFVDIDLSKGFESQEEATIKLNKILKMILSIIKNEVRWLQTNCSLDK